ncbi:LuxR C-terminal-related transcriptional regulator [uncultured Algibacter sp.]|uniref:helix-turn-helix transcriptional regulator n=1 Tax=uncultured Algibacter sp. TaxID=298659 RepID=UPI00262F2E4A|nr:LuxR C-terminal-related transcriptional regulator [uncultured Algibacter sp.]
MLAIKSLLKTINDLKQKGLELSEEDILTLLKATKSIAKNKTALNSYISFFKRLDKKKLDNINSLTKRELEILKSIGKGESSLLIAKNLNLSISTIETHRKNIRKKLELIGKGKLIEYAILSNLKSTELN